MIAGVLIGLLTVKPQLGVLFPFALIASGRWRVFLWAAVTTLALLALSVALGGMESWHDYIVKALPLQREVLGDAAGTAVPFQPTIFMNVRGLVGNRIGEAIQFAFTLAAVVAVAAAFRYRNGSDMRLLRALFFACTVSASPYMGAYDLLPLTFAAVALLADENSTHRTPRSPSLCSGHRRCNCCSATRKSRDPGLSRLPSQAYLIAKLFAPAMRHAAQDEPPRRRRLTRRKNTLLSKRIAHLIMLPP